MLRAPGVLVHGGAGDVPESRSAAHVAGCERAARAGCEVLRAGGSAVDAVQRAVEVMEDDPHFNAGTGAALDADGDLSLDASIMDGRTLDVGAVGALPAFRHPIAVAREVLRDGRHVLLVSDGAFRFAVGRGFSAEDPARMITPAAREKLAAFLAGQGTGGWAGGTVGAVAFDGAHVAAATSTGGTVGKRPGRVGDSPIPGAGTFADDSAGAVGCTGDGEAVLRTALAARIAEMLRQGVAPQKAADAAMELLASRGRGTGGVIVMGHQGIPALARITRTLSHAYVSLDGMAFSGV